MGVRVCGGGGVGPLASTGVADLTHYSRGGWCGDNRSWAGGFPAIPPC